MANLTLVLLILCAIGIWYAGRLYDGGKIRRYRNLKHTIEKRALPAMVISAVLTIILG